MNVSLNHYINLMYVQLYESYYWLCSVNTFSTAALATSQVTGPVSSAYSTGSGRPNLINASMRSTDDADL